MTRGQRVLALVSGAGLIVATAVAIRSNGLSEDARGAGLIAMVMGFGVGLFGSQVRKGGFGYGGVFSRDPPVGLGLAVGWLAVLLGVAGFRLVVM
jgi:hypothetical protein